MPPFETDYSGEERFIICGFFNNLFSQGSGGYDYMEFVSNATPMNAIPSLTLPYRCRLVKITCNYLGLSALGAGAGESWTVKCVVIPHNQSPTIGNSVDRGDNLFVWDSTLNGTFPSTSVDCQVDFEAGERIALVGTEQGTVTDNTAEAQVCLVFQYL